VTANGERYEAERLVLALGVVDELPDIPGIGDRWGRSVFHCPYCHGYELDQGKIGVLATGPASVHQAMMLPDWGPTTYFTRGIDPTPEEREALLRRGVTIEAGAVAGIDDVATVRLEDGRALPFAGIFLVPTIRIAGSFASDLGLELEDGMFGAIIKTDPMKQTSVPGVFAAGDAALVPGSVSFAVADGARAGISAHRSLIFA
jgi:thioredoxin reductase